MFDNFFAKQRTLVNETSKLPIDYFKREIVLFSTVSFTKDDIATNLDPNKVHDYDRISIRVLKISNDSI